MTAELVSFKNAVPLQQPLTLRWLCWGVPVRYREAWGSHSEQQGFTTPASGPWSAGSRSAGLTWASPPCLRPHPGHGPRPFLVWWQKHSERAKEEAARPLQGPASEISNHTPSEFCRSELAPTQPRIWGGEIDPHAHTRTLPPQEGEQRSAALLTCHSLPWPQASFRSSVSHPPPHPQVSSNYGGRLSPEVEVLWSRACPGAIGASWVWSLGYGSGGRELATSGLPPHTRPAKAGWQ